MGLFAILRRWLLGAGDEPAPNAEQAPASRRKSAPAPAPAPALSRRALPRLKHRSSLVRTPRTREVSASTAPYRFAPHNPRTGQVLDLSTDADARWLDHYSLPHLRTPEDLAVWCGLPLGRLAWLTHRFSEQRFRPGDVGQSHYHYRWLKKRSGGFRLIESPKATLKGVQRRILRKILDHVPPHAAAHGFVAERSLLSNAQPHVGSYVLLKYDLENFYPSVSYARVTAMFRSLGFSREVALWLARLTISAVPGGLTTPDGTVAPLRPYLRRHLPQGAPTSPALANLSAFSLDVRLAGLARAFDVTYTRYADDLTFSGSRRFAGALRNFIPFVEQIIRDERFRVNHRKRRILRHNQRQTVTGVVVNEHPNLCRSEFDLLKAILTNCVRRGPATQNRDQHSDYAAHLRGRVAHARFLNPQRGERLLRIFEKIDWSR